PALRGEEPRRQDVAHEDRLLVLDALRDGCQVQVGGRHHAPLGLAAAQPTEVAAVAEDRPRLALGPPASAAEAAVAAGRVEGGHHPVSTLEGAHPRAGLLDQAHELVTDGASPRTRPAA